AAGCHSGGRAGGTCGAILRPKSFLGFQSSNGAAHVRAGEPIYCRASDRFSERRQFAGASRDLRTALAGGGSEARTTRATRLLLERRCVLSRKALGRGVFGVSKGARAR